LPASYFDRLYSESQDPWGFATSQYEKIKYERTLEALDGQTFDRALEVGCSIGVFTERLASICGRVVAVDVSRLAVDRARKRLTANENVVVEQMSLPSKMPEGNFDLIVCSEVLYYLTPEDLRRALDSFGRKLRAGGTFVAVHWRPNTQTYPMQGAEVHQLLRGEAPWTLYRSEVTEHYLLDVYRSEVDAQDDAG
jgi:SAM-dependent methyltransferase